MSTHDDYHFEDVSQDPNRKSDVWKFFHLDKKKEVGKCLTCFEKHKLLKIFKAPKGTTKSMSNHLERFHKPSDGTKSTIPFKQVPTPFVKRKCLEESIVKLALERISFRAIASDAMRDLVSVSYYAAKFFNFLGAFFMGQYFELERFSDFILQNVFITRIFDFLP